MGETVVVAKLQGAQWAPSSPVVQALHQQGVKGKQVRGGMLFDLPVDGEGDGAVYGVSSALDGARLFLQCAEHGGMTRSGGEGVVVCGLSGKPLHPFFITNGHRTPCGIHARFSVPDAVVTVTGHARSSRVTIREHRIVREGSRAWVEEAELWDGSLEGIPQEFQRFVPAAEAASRKGNCSGCTHTHYVAVAEIVISGNGRHGGNGAATKKEGQPS